LSIGYLIIFFEVVAAISEGFLRYPSILVKTEFIKKAKCFHRLAWRKWAVELNFSLSMKISKSR